MQADQKQCNFAPYHKHGTLSILSSLSANSTLPHSDTVNRMERAKVFQHALEFEHIEI